jgi:hypothetical protein
VSGEKLCGSGMFVSHARGRVMYCASRERSKLIFFSDNLLQSSLLVNMLSIVY